MILRETPLTYMPDKEEHFYRIQQILDEIYGTEMKPSNS